MTECTTDGVSFARQGRRVVRAQFDGGRITSDAGGCSSARPTGASASPSGWPGP